jgi:integrase
MATIKIKHVNEFEDRHGKKHCYFRRPGCKSIRLPLSGSPDFLAAYTAALAGVSPKTAVGPRPSVGTVATTVMSYFSSAAFHELAAETQRGRRAVLERFALDHGDKRIAALERHHVQDMVAAKRATPGSARVFLSTLAALMNFAVENGIRDDNPATGIKRPKLSADGWQAWSEADIARFEERHPIGTMGRLALALLLYTGQRRSDVIKMGVQHIKNGAIHLRQQKTGTALIIPIHPELQAVIDGTPSRHLTFLTMESGEPFRGDRFTHWFRSRCEEADISTGLSAHGLRKAACRRLAEAGCSTSVIAAISGHKTLSEVQRYTASADQARLAGQGMAAITATTTYKPNDPFVRKAKKR